MSTLRKRLLLFAPNLYGGGAERTLARLANHWAEQDRFVTVVTISNIHPNDFPLSPRVDRIGLGLTSNGGFADAVRGNLERMRAVQWAIAEMRPDVVVSFIEQANVLALLAAQSQRVPVIVSERTDPSKHLVPAPWRWMRRHTYPRAESLVVLTEETAELMAEFYPRERMVVIPNSVAAIPSSSEAGETAEVPRESILLGVGRLAAAKGFDRLIEAVSLLIERGAFEGWKLVLVGDGPERTELTQQAADLPAGTVEFAGRVANPEEWYRRASLFALPSRYEGFPNALLEAMAAGLPAVAFENCATRQIIRHDWDGLLVPEEDVPALAQTLAALISDPSHRQTLGRSARDVVDRFSESDFWSRWDEVVDRGGFRKFPESHRARRRVRE